MDPNGLVADDWFGFLFLRLNIPHCLCCHRPGRQHRFLKIDPKFLETGIIAGVFDGQTCQKYPSYLEIKRVTSRLQQKVTES